MNMTPDEKINEIIERYPEFWKTKSSYMSYIRGGVRQGLWNRNKIKLLKIKNNRVQILNPNPKGKKETVWGGECEVCKNLFPTALLQVDHIRDKGSSLKNFSDVSKFIEDMILITEDDLQIVCKGCHEIISHSQKKGCSFEEARIQKEFIEIKKQKKVLDRLSEFNLESPPKLKKDQESLLLKLMLGEVNE